MIRMVKQGRAVWASVIVFFAGMGVAFAQGGTQAITLTDPLGGSESFTTVATAVASFLFWDIAMPLSVIMVLVGAFKFMTSAGDPEKVSEARKTILYAALGFAIACLCGAITNIIKSFVTGS
ncbi:MAG: hypothetical protein ABR884_04130 [Minisyncoccia bacterium]